ncbi:MAG: hypothetical protein CVU56_28970 [Deltaproteobacteria bacterium HGW-Deltaproteobacteria-14]|nr:MAG: hypothetical protein CVU56_28970 [Deltaproteobacteria bacterium HGW-Deltaproteobacteria-14]
MTLPTACLLAASDPAPDALPALGCAGDFEALASEPLDTSIPGARSVKVVLDRLGGDALYFQNSVTYPIHHAFVSANLSGGALPVVGALSEFNTTEYFSPDRRFLLGAVTYYAGPAAWALEIAPYDTASPAMIATLFDAVRAHAWFGAELAFHPTSVAVAATAEGLPASVPIVTTDTLYAGVDYQPLNLAVAYGRLHLITADALAATYVPYRDIVVLDHVPNDITVVAGIITEEFQTPLSHINVLSQNRRTPNMGLRGAMTNPELLALDGGWVRLEVGALAWSVTPATLDEADAWWEQHKPTPVTLPAANLSVTDLRDLAEVTPEPAAGGSLRTAIADAVRAFGGKAAHYSVLARTADVPVRPAFAIPAFYYDQFMRDNGLYDRLAAMTTDEAFRADPAVRDTQLASFRAAISGGAVDADLQRALKLKLALEYPGQSMRFRSSTNSEDLDGFPCAGCYESHTGDAGDWADVLDAIRDTWASAFLFRTFEERSYYGVDHAAVVMPLLVHHNFPDEAANGVALTANPYDATGLQPGFYINVQYGGDVEVVHPPAGTTSDEIIYQYGEPGQPVSYLAHSNLVASGATVLTSTQLHQLGRALTAIHARFSPAYGPLAGNNGWYAMDVEFKFESPAAGEPATLVVKQARPNPGRGE